MAHAPRFNVLIGEYHMDIFPLGAFNDLYERASSYTIMPERECSVTLRNNYRLLLLGYTDGNNYSEFFYISSFDE